MKILYTTKEGGKINILEANLKPGEEIFAMFFPDGIIWDKVAGIDKISVEKFEEAYKDATKRTCNEEYARGWNAACKSIEITIQELNKI